MWLIIGYGSSLHADDRFGIVVAEQLRNLVADDLAEVITTHQLQPELAEPISRFAGVIFVDACTSLPPGEVACLDLQSRPGPNHEPVSSAFSHATTPRSLLDCARELYGQAPPGFLYLVGGEDFELGEQMSLTVANMVAPVVSSIVERIKRGNGAQG